METPSSSSPSSSSSTSPATAAPSPPDKYNVRWTTHHAETWSAFSSLLATGRFVDVTLSCRNRTFRAHRVVLSACSPYLRDLLDSDAVGGGGSGGGGGGPIIILQDATPEAVEHVIEFMYTGSVDIPSRCLADFIKLAECFQVRGIKRDAETRPSSSSSPSKLMRPDHGLPSPPSSTHDDDGDRSPKRRLSTASSNDFLPHHYPSHHVHPHHPHHQQHHHPLHSVHNHPHPAGHLHGQLQPPQRRKPHFEPDVAHHNYFRGLYPYGQGQHGVVARGSQAHRTREDEPVAADANSKTSYLTGGGGGGDVSPDREDVRVGDGDEREEDDEEPCDFSMSKPRDGAKAGGGDGGEEEDDGAVDDEDDDGGVGGVRYDQPGNVHPESYVIINDGAAAAAGTPMAANNRKRRLALQRHLVDGDDDEEEDEDAGRRWDPRRRLSDGGRQLVPVEVTMGDDGDYEDGDELGGGGGGGVGGAAGDGAGGVNEDDDGSNAQTEPSLTGTAMRLKSERNPPALLPYQGESGRPFNIPADVSPESPLFKVSNSDTIWVGKTYNNWTMYFCSLCPYQSRIKSHLWRHSVKHTGQKPFVCAICLKAFSRRDNLKQHMNYKHPGYDLPPKRDLKRETTPNGRQHASEISRIDLQIPLQESAMNAIKAA